jgi:hypothetical protein
MFIIYIMEKAQNATTVGLMIVDASLPTGHIMWNPPGFHICLVKMTWIPLGFHVVCPVGRQYLLI